MITFEMKKPKALSMPILVEGIDQGHLKFRFTIEMNNVSYSFPAVQEGDTVKFMIPALDTIVKNPKEGIYKARLEVSALTEGDRGFYMNPWSEEIRVKKSVSIEVQPVTEEQKKEMVSEDVKVKVTTKFVEEDITVADLPIVEETKDLPKVAKNDTLRKRFM